MRMLIRASLALAAAASLAACGTASAPAATGHRRAHTTSAASHLAVPAAGSRGEAVALARLILSRIRLPAGARLLPAEPVPAALRHPALLGLAAASLDVHELYALPEPMGTAASFLMAHRPPGMSWSSDGTLSGPGGPESQDISYTVRSVPSGVYTAQLGVTIAPRASGGSVLRADAQVLWYPPRTAAEYIQPGRYHVLTITVTIFGAKKHTVRTVVTSPAAIARLAGILDASRVLPSRTISCTLPSVYYRLAFAAAKDTGPGVVVDVSRWPCEGIQIRVDGRTQPSLQAGIPLVDAIDRLLGIKP